MSEIEIIIIAAILISSVVLNICFLLVFRVWSKQNIDLAGKLQKSQNQYWELRDKYSHEVIKLIAQKETLELQFKKYRNCYLNLK